jgi:hypothetical protein
MVALLSFGMNALLTLSGLIPLFKSDGYVWTITDAAAFIWAQGCIRKHCTCEIPLCIGTLLAVGGIEESEAVVASNPYFMSVPVLLNCATRTLEISSSEVQSHYAT